MSNLKIRPINTGFVTTVPKEYLYHHSVVDYIPNIPDERIEMPVFTFLVEGGDKLLLIDTGMAPTDRASTYHHPSSRQPEGMAIHEQLECIGYHPQDIDIIVFTHLHWDHVFQIERFVNADLYVHKREFKFAFDPIPLYFKSYEHPALGITRPFEGMKFIQISGETEIMPGVRAYESFGHSPGHMSVEVETGEGSYICVGDSIFQLHNINPVPEMHYEITPPGRFYNIIETWDSIVSQKARVKDSSYILCTHEPSLIDRIEKTPLIG